MPGCYVTVGSKPAYKVEEPGAGCRGTGGPLPRWLVAWTAFFAREKQHYNDNRCCTLAHKG
ncbi:cell division protein FtsK [Alcanivorax sp. NBRC 101098]|nr:cell division protein FtsK [Alcanivorax sp. NBRC 101098]